MQRGPDRSGNRSLQDSISGKTSKIQGSAGQPVTTCISTYEASGRRNSRQSLVSSVLIQPRQNHGEPGLLVVQSKSDPLTPPRGNHGHGYRWTVNPQLFITLHRIVGNNRIVEEEDGTVLIFRRHQ